MPIQKQFVLRYRDEGHLRFEVPAQFCNVTTANALTAALLAVEGVYRVQVYRSQKKLVIRYQESVSDFKSLAKSLFQIVTELEQKQLRDKQLVVSGALKSTSNLKNKLTDKVKSLRVSQWFGEKVDDAKETVQAAKFLTKGLKKKKALIQDPEKAITDFLNDVLVLFLIRLHWDHITKEWIPHPFKYRNEWAAVFYMLFLLMRSRKPKK